MYNVQFAHSFHDLHYLRSKFFLFDINIVIKSFKMQGSCISCHNVDKINIKTCHYFNYAIISYIIYLHFKRAKHI